MPSQHMNKQALNLYNWVIIAAAEAGEVGFGSGGGGGGSSSLHKIPPCCPHSNKSAKSGSKKGRIFRHDLTEDPTS